MQPKHRRLVTEENLENHTEEELKPVIANVNLATSTSTQALSTAQDSKSASNNAVNRVEQLETMGGLAPGEVTDAQTANLLYQPSSLTHAAFGNTMATELSSAHSTGRAALNAITAQFVSSGSVERIVASADPAQEIREGDLHLVYELPTWFEDFSGGLTRWSAQWLGQSSWTVQDGAVHSPIGAPTSRRLLIADEVQGEADVELAARVKVGAADSGIKAGLLARVSGETGSERGYILGLIGQSIQVARYVGGSFSVIATDPFPHTGDQWLWLRFRVVGNVLQASAWADGATEPTEWIIDTTDTSIPEAGGVGIGGVSLSGAWWDQVGIAARGGSAPTSGESGPPEKTFRDFSTGMDGLTPLWNRPGSWASSDGDIIASGQSGRRLLVLDNIVPEPRDVDVVALVSVDTLDPAMSSAIAARASGNASSETGYFLGLTGYAHGQYLSAGSMTDGNWQNIQDVSFSYGAGQRVWLRMRIIGSTFQGKAWPETGAEPSNWMIQKTNESIAAPGMVGLFASAAATQRWHAIGVAIDGGIAPKGD